MKLLRKSKMREIAFAMAGHTMHERDLNIRGTPKGGDPLGR